MLAVSRQSLDQRDRGRARWHPVLPPAFHALAGIVQRSWSISRQVARSVSPVLVAQKDGELKRSSRDAGRTAQLGHEAEHVAVGHGGMMLDQADLAPRRQELLEMPAPPGRVGACPVAGDRGPRQHAFDPAAKPPGSLGLHGPDRLEDPQYQRCVDRIDGRVAEYRIGVGLEGARPLPRCFVLRQATSWLAI